MIPPRLACPQASIATGLPGYTIPGGSDVLGATSLSQTFDFGYLDTTAGHDTYPGPLTRSPRRR